MGLSRVSKKRLVSSARMVKNTRSMAKEMNLLNSEYALELQELINSFLNSNKPLNQEKREAINNNQQEIVVSNQREEIYTESKNTKEHSGPINNLDIPNIEKEEIPAWAKEIWREIMKHCHPDKIDSLKLSIEEQFLRKQILDGAMISYKNTDWDEILFLGIMLNKFTDKLSSRKQLDKLNRLYEKDAKQINEIQNSVSWNWGNSWENLEDRVNILILCLHQQKIPVPPRAVLIKEIVNLEL